MILTVSQLSLPGALLIRSNRFADDRGYFAETYVYRDYLAVGISNIFVQDNQSYSTAAGTIRGLHFQNAPFAQAKLIRVTRGRIFDVIVDLRRSSATFGRHTAVELSDKNGDQLFIPAGFAHGFCTLVPHTEVSYKVDAIFSATNDGGLNAADAELGIPWPVSTQDAVMSPKDRLLPMFRDLPGVFA
jgi:dTDP-4-dehydrorhamnose 3,5-epimerase